MKFNVITLVGVVLLILGVLGLLGIGIPTSETVVDAGPIEISATEERTIPTVVAAGLLVAGLAAAAIGQIKG